MNGQLAVSRAFGDKSLKSHLRSDPAIHDTTVDTKTDLLVLASDGLWKVILISGDKTERCHAVLIFKLSLNLGDGKSRSGGYRNKNQGPTESS